MAVKVTSITVHPARAEGLRSVRDEQDLPSMDAALQSLLEDAGRKSTLMPTTNVDESKPE